MYNIGITIYLYNATKSVGAVALMWLSRAALRIPVLYLSGIISDSCNKKRVIVLTNLLSVPVSLLFIFANVKRLWLIYLLAFLLQSLNDIDENSESAVLPQLVSKEELSYSNSVFSFLQSTGMFLSPAIGGILYKLFGSDILFIINAFSFLLAGGLFAFIKYIHIVKGKDEARLGIIKGGIEGFNILLEYANVKTIFIIMSIFAVLGRFYETYKVAVSDLLLRLAPEGIIYFDYALAIGGLSVPLIIKMLSKHNDVLVFTLSSLMIALGYIVFGYSHSITATLITLIFLGFTQNIQGVYSRTVIQNNIPREYLGRVFSFYKILLTFFAILGLLIASPLYNLIGISCSFLIMAAIMFVLCTHQFIYKVDYNKAKHKEII